MSDISQSEVIRSSKWEKALFTSYALSLTFFETILLPRLRESNCRHIYVLVDAEGYANSLVERRSASVGKEFVLIPILAKGSGIFHPKVTYLWGEQDVLMVGSGNLTFGGHGRNIEVLEILKANSDPEAFLDFAEFLETLSTDDRYQIADLTPLEEFAERSRSITGPINTDSTTRVLHSITTPISQQVVTHFADRAPVQELFCLSPYHHPEARPVKELIGALGASRLIVGMPSKKQETTSFPIHLAENWGVELALVAPVVEKPNRSLHAKWLEFRGDETWSLTGSVNATHQSLASTLNVEVAVLRQLSEPTSLHWMEVEAPAYKKNDFITGTSAHFIPVFAKLSEGGSIIGQIVDNNGRRGRWSAQLHESGNEFATGSVEVNEANEFEWNIGHLVQIVHGNAIQIQLYRENEVARGWLSVQTMLRLSSQSRAGIRAISRMLRREDSLEDIQAVLDLVAIHSHKIISTSSHKKAAFAGTPESLPDDTAVPVQDLAVLDDEGHLVNKLIESEGRNRNSADVLRLIGQLFRGKRVTPAGTSAPVHPKVKRTGDEDDDGKHEETKTKIAALEVFNDQMSEALRSAKGSGPGVDAILFVWLHVNIDMLLRDIEEGVTKLLSFAARWMNLVSNHARMQSYEDALCGPVFGVAAVLAQLDKSSSDNRSLYQHLQMPDEKLHQCLESFVGGSVSADRAVQDALAWMQYSAVLELIDDQAGEAIESIKRVLSKPTYRAILFSIVKARKNRENYDFDEAIFDTRVKKLIATIQRAENVFSITGFVDRHSLTGCPSCHISLLQDTLSKLQSSRIVKCDNCTTILLALKP